MLSSKLHLTVDNNRIISRDKVLSLLDSVWQNKLTLIKAPAGYGKTTAVVDWLNKRQYPAAWLSLDEYDDMPRMFWNYIITALEDIVPGIGRDIEYILSDKELLDANIHIDILIDRLREIDADFILVLDDMHLINNQIILRGVTRLIDYMPERMHLLLISRKEPDIEMAKIRIRWQTFEIDVKDLRFSEEDISLFYQARGITLGIDELRELENYTEGWIASLVAIAMKLEKEHISHIPMESLSLCNHDICKYLKDEVLSGWSEEKVRFALETSILDFLSVEVCEAITGCSNASQLLGKILQDYGFLAIVDEEKGLYRYHYIFKDFLNKLLLDQEPLLVQELHKRAAVWYLQKGLIHKATDHFICGGYYKEALKLIENPDILHKYDNSTLVSWLERIPEELTAHSFFTAYIYSAYYAQMDRLDIAKQLLDKMKILVAYPQYANDQNLSDFYHTACLLSETNLLMREGDIRFMEYFLSAVATIHKIRFQYGDYLDFNTTDIYFYRCPISIFTKLIDKDPEKYNLFVKGFRERMIRKNPGYKQLAQGEYLYETNRMEEAMPYLLESIDEARTVGCLGALVPAMMDIVRIKRANGDLYGAFTVLEECEKMLSATGKIHWNMLISAFRCRLYLDAGDTEHINKWFLSSKLNVFSEISRIREYELLVYARVLIAIGCLEDAGTLLLRLLSFTEKKARMHSQVEVLNLLAIFEDMRGRQPNALAYLDRSLSVGLENHYIRNYLDEGAPMEKLLALYHGMNAGSENADFAWLLLKQMKNADVFIKGVRLTESLTVREREVLALLLEAYTNKEISEKMGLALQTVKTHIGNIYGKLGVTSRAQCQKLIRGSYLTE